MSRTYSNFLLFEDTLDNMPTSSPVMVQALNILLSPSVTIVENDCNTFLGRMSDVSRDIEGYIHVSTKEVLSSIDIDNLLASGTYKTGIRDLRTCMSHSKGGVCQMCYKSSFFTTVAPDVGTTVKVPSKLIYQTDILVGNGYSSNFVLSETSDDWYDVVVCNKGFVVNPLDYTLGTNTIEFPVPPGTDRYDDVYSVHYFKQNTDPFLGYISKTYSGALLGMLPLPTLSMMLRESMYELQFSDGMVAQMIEEIEKFKAIPSTYKDYVSKVHGKMEQLLLTMYLYSLYANIEI